MVHKTAVVRRDAQTPVRLTVDQHRVAGGQVYVDQQVQLKILAQSLVTNSDYDECEEHDLHAQSRLQSNFHFKSTRSPSIGIRAHQNRDRSSVKARLKALK